MDETRVAMEYPLKGILVGNGATSWEFDSLPSTPETAFGMGLITQTLIDQWNAAGCTYYFDGTKDGDATVCDPIWTKMSASWNDLNVYDFFRTNEVKITPPSAEERMGKTIINGVEKTYKRGMLQSEYTPWLKDFIKDDKLMYTGLSDFLSNADVRTALHIREDAPAWEMCSDTVGEGY